MIIHHGRMINNKGTLPTWPKPWEGICQSETKQQESEIAEAREGEGEEVEEEETKEEDKTRPIAISRVLRAISDRPTDGRTD